ASNGRKIDDMARASLSHLRQTGANQVHRTEVVDLHLLLFVLDRHVLHYGAVGDAGVVYQDVDRGDGALHFADQFATRGVVRDVQREDGDARALRDFVVEQRRE